MTDLVRTRAVLEGAWSASALRCMQDDGTPATIWDGCASAIGWLALKDPRALDELHSLLQQRSASSLVAQSTSATSLTQSPLYCHVLALAKRAGLTATPELVQECQTAVVGLRDMRADHEGMIVILDPSEGGWGASPRWPVDDAGDLSRALHVDSLGVAWNSDAFVVASAGVNAVVAHAAINLAGLTFDPHWAATARDLADAIDRVCWDPALGYWRDQIHVGDSAACAVPTLDGLLPALVTTDPVKGQRALEHLATRFVGEFGVAMVAMDHPSFQPDVAGAGAAAAMTDHLAVLVAERWDDKDLALRIAQAARRGVAASDHSRHRNPLTGAPVGRGSHASSTAAMW